MHRPLRLSALALLTLATAAAAQTTAPSTVPATATAPSGLLAELSQRRAALREDDMQARLELATWCRNNALWTPMSELAREVLEHTPDSRVAFNLLLEYDQRVPLPADPEWETRELAKLKDRFAHEFKIRQTHHFVILYDTPDSFAAARAAQLEKVYDAFMFYLNLRTVHPSLLTRRLPMFLFAERADFLSYARQSDGAELSWAAGYYSQRSNVVAFYDDTTSKAAEKADAQIEAQHARAAELTRQAESLAKTDPIKARQLLAERTQLLQLVTRAKAESAAQSGLHNNSKTLHEAAHQLAFNTGIQTRLVDYPLWISEGLACAFELPDAAGHIGPAQANLGRAGIAKTAARDKLLIPLERFVSENPPRDADVSTVGIWYAQSWALFHFLYRFERPKLEAYLTAYAQAPAMRALSPDFRKRLFIEAFGSDFAALEKRFVAHVNALPGRLTTLPKE